MGRIIKDWPTIVGSIMCFVVVLIVVGGAANLLVNALVKAIATLLGFGS